MSSPLPRIRRSQPRMSRTIAGLLATFGLLVALVVGMGTLLSPASADDGGLSISHIEQDGTGLKVLVNVPVGQEVDLSSVSMTVAGQSTTATAKAAGGTGATVSRTAMLVLDTSHSMIGAKIAAAKQAAMEYIHSLPPDVKLGIVTFDSTARTALNPTVDRGAALKVVNNISLSLQTHLYDGVVQAVNAAGDVGQRSLLLISDGADTTNTPLSEATQAIKSSGTQVEVVALGDKGKALLALQTLAHTGGGSVINASTDQLSKLFTAQAQQLAAQVLVTAPVPASVTQTSGQISVSFTSNGTTESAQAFTTIQPSTLPIGGVSTVKSIPSWLFFAGIIALGIGLLLFLMLMIPGRAATDVEDRVDAYVGATSGKVKGDTKGKNADEALAGAKDAAQTLLSRNQGLEIKIARRLDGAGSDMKPAEWLLVHFGIVVLLTLVGLAFSGMNVIVGLVFMAVGILGPWMWLGYRRNKRRRAFSDMLPDTLQLMSGALSAGLSLAQSVDTIVREGSEPVAGEFRRVLVEARLGVEIEDSLEGVAERFESRDFLWVVMAIRIQRQVGGNLAELLDTVAATMRERAYLRRQVRSLSAEGRLSAAVLGGLPPIFFLYLFLVNRPYVSPLFNDPRGIAMITGAAIWLTVGILWMKKLVDVDV
jgi:tight adherence protein B